MMKENILEMRNVSKSFPGVKALNKVNLTIKSGSVHALMGENGAGKSTLMKVLYGIYHPEEGEILFKGDSYLVKSPIDAIKSGVSMIPQEISPIPNLSVASNVFLGKEILGNGLKFVNQKKIEEETKKLFTELGIDIDPAAMMGDITIANAQLVAIATAVSYNSDLIIMDEPTSALTEKEVAKLYDIIQKLKNERNLAIIYISHKLDEVFQICDEVTVLRDGQFIGTDTIENFDKDRLISMMVGRDMEEFFHKEVAKIGEVLLSVKNLGVTKKFKNVSFDLKRGEVLGVAGLMGAGRTELMEALFGFVPYDEGEVIFEGEKIEIKTPIDAISHRIGFVTEDRKLTGLFLDLSVKDNMIMPDIGTYLNRGLLNFKKIRENCQSQREALQIKTPTLEQLIKNLSGGNQQKVLISRWLLTEPEILILDEPTRGIDVGAKAEIHRLIGELAKMGKAIIMVSSEMPEILSISDRIIVMHEGELSGELQRSEATQEKILQLATGEKL
ncbi:MAG: sugar ABC transporter ATP-binding protein [Bacteroidetes bacterium]|nr:sugar ABC transporter ATP-binding protein [Bacteroidota bacterium]